MASQPCVHMPGDRKCVVLPVRVATISLSKSIERSIEPINRDDQSILCRDMGIDLVPRPSSTHCLRMRVNFPTFREFRATNACLNVTTAHCRIITWQFGSASIITIQKKRSVYIRCPASSLLVSGTQASQHHRECSVPD